MASLNDVDAWMSGRPDADAYVTKALQMSFTDDTTTQMTSPDVSSIFNLVNFPGPETSSVAPKADRHVEAGKPTGGVSKRRKPRASKKRSQTTFIEADPANFRQMVQQVTGVKVVGGDWGPPPVVVKPAPQRPTGGLPTLDTSSSFLFGGHLHRPYPGHVVHQQQEERLGPDGPGIGVNGPGGYNGLEAFSGFPTLDSWKVIM